MFGHGEHESGLTHGRTGCDDHEVRCLPTRSDLVECMESGRDTGDRTGVLSGFLHSFEGLLDDRIYLCHIAFLRPLRDLEDSRFGGLHQFIHVLCLVKTHLLDLCRKGNHIAGGGFLGDNLCMVTQVSRRSDPSRQISQIDGASGFL